MLKRYLLTSAAAVACAAGLSSAQTPTTGAAPQVPPAAQSSRPSPQSTTTDRPAERSPVTVTGCLVREQDVAGHATSDVDRGGRFPRLLLVGTDPSPAELTFRQETIS